MACATGRRNRLEVQEFLDSCGMNIRSYASKLAAHGFDELSCLKCAQLEDLTTAGVLVGHARKIMAALAKENGEPTASPAQREMESGWNSATTPDKQDEEYDGDMPIETVTLPDDQVRARPIELSSHGSNVRPCPRLLKYLQSYVPGCCCSDCHTEHRSAPRTPWELSSRANCLFGREIHVPRDQRCRGGGGGSFSGSHRCAN
jgi:hypothetical protein